MGQELRLDSVLSSRASLSSRKSSSSMTNGNNASRGARHSASSKSIWEPICIFPNFPHQVLCGDSWGNSSLVLGTSNGTFLVMAPSKKPVSKYSQHFASRGISFFKTQFILVLTGFLSNPNQNIQKRLLNRNLV